MPFDWEGALDRFDDYLTDEEVRTRRERIERSCADALGVSGAEAIARHDPSLGNMLIPFFVVLAFAVGGLLAYLTN